LRRRKRVKSGRLQLEQCNCRSAAHDAKKEHVGLARVSGHINQRACDVASLAKNWLSKLNKFVLLMPKRAIIIPSPEKVKSKAIALTSMAQRWAAKDRRANLKLHRQRQSR